MLRYIILFIVMMVVVLHYVPVVSKTGFLDKGRANLCSYINPQPDTYRLIPNGLHGYHVDLKFFKKGSPGLSCAEPVKLRLYLW